MKESKKKGQWSSVRAFSLLVDIIWIIAVVGLVMTLAMVLVILIRSWGEKSIMIQTGISLSAFLNSIIFVLIIFYVRKILRSIKAKSPFETVNIQRMKKIAYAVFALIPIDILGEIMIRGFDSVLKKTLFVELIWGGLFKLLFLGLGILVIAKVFESGLELQKEKSLTI